MSLTAIINIFLRTMFMKRIFLYITMVLSCIIIPAVIAAAILLTLSVKSGFYISIVKRMNLVETFIETKNSQIEKDIMREVEKKTGLSTFKPEFETVRRDYEEKLVAYSTINKSLEYDRIDKQIDELDDLKWEKSSDEFKTEDDFDRYKKNRIKELKISLKEIKEYRDKNDDAIDKAEDVMKAAKDKFEDAEDMLKDKESLAKDIIKSRRDEFMNEMFSDIAKIEPALTEKLNTLFLDRELKSVIQSYIDFITSWKRQKSSGNVYISRLNIESGSIENVKKIILPPLKLSLLVRDNSSIEKNLLSEVFVETIDRTPGLKSPWVLSRIFKLSDSWIVEAAGNSYLKGIGLTISSGVIRSNQLVISGRRAEILEKVMMILSVAVYTPLIAGSVIILALLLIIFLSSDIRSGIRKAGFVLKYPSAAIVVLGIAVIIASLKPGLMIPQIVNDPVNSAFFDKLAFTVALHFFAPVTAVFFVFSLAGGLLMRIGKKRDKANS